MERKPTGSQNVLLLCGMFAALVLIGSDLLANGLWQAYDPIAQSISDLSALGAPTRPLTVATDLIFAILMTAFGIGAWRCMQKRSLRAAAVLISANALLLAVKSAFLAVPLGQAPFTSPTSSGQVAVGAASMLCFLLAIGFGAAALRGWFRIFSIAILLAFGLLTVLRLAGILPIPPDQATSGVQERTMMYAYVLWAAVLAARLYWSKHLS